MTTTDIHTLHDSLRRWDARRRRQELLTWLPRALLVGLLLGLAVALLGRARPLLTRSETAQIAAALALAALLIATGIVLLRRRSLTERARFADRRLGLRERTTTAIEIHDGRLPAPPELAARQLRDAVSAATGVDTARSMPLVARAVDWLPALLALGLLAALVLLPNPQEAVLLEQRAVAAAVAEQTAALNALAEEIAADDTLTAEQREALLQPLDEALAALAEPDVGREEAVAALSQAETELRELSAAMDAAPLAEALAEAAAQGGDEAAAQLAEALQSGDATAAADALAEALAGLEPEARAELAQRLAEAAESSATDAATAEALARAAEALAEGDTAAAAETLGEVAVGLGEQAAQAEAAAGQAARAAEELGAAREAVAQVGEPAGGASARQEAQNGDGDGETTGAGEQSDGGDSSSGGPTAGGGHVENVFVPPQAAIDGEGQSLELDVNCAADPQSCGPLGGQSPTGLPDDPAAGGVLPYDQVFGDYRDAAFETLAGGDIPLSLQNLVRDYFSALEP